MNLKRIRCYDNGGKSIDRYTVVYLDDKQRDSKTYGARAMNAHPFNHQGFGQYCTAMLGKHLGKKIKFEELPKDCQTLVIEDLSGV